MTPTTNNDKNGVAPYTHVRVFKNSVSMSTGYLVFQFYANNTSDSFDFDATLYGIFLYEGAFVNPYYHESLDDYTRVGFIRSDLSNFPSSIYAFNFTQKNSRDTASLSYKTFLANKYYNLLRIATNDTMTGISYDGIEYINIRGGYVLSRRKSVRGLCV